jgi:AraC-like DNA-binding protein
MPRGVLRPEDAAGRFTLARPAPSAALAPFVDYHWIVRWDLRGEPDFEQTILPHPNVHLAFEDSAAGIFGVVGGLFTRRLSGLGKALGVRFRPGGFRPFWGASVSQLNGRVVPAGQLFGPAVERTRKMIMDQDVGDREMVSHAEALLCAFLPEPDPAAEQAAELVALITGDPALRRVSQLSAASGLTVRSLQRLFAEYVGVSPKWVMRRARLHEAALHADSGDPVDWAQLAADLGYADQAHLTRDFTSTLGAPPTQYAS